MSVPKYEQEYYEYQADKIEIEPHFISQDYIKDYNEQRNEKGIIDENNINKKYEAKDYELLFQLGAKQNTYPVEELRDSIDTYSTFLIKQAMKHYLGSAPGSFVLRDLLPIDIVFEGDLGPEVFDYNYMRPKPWTQRYNLGYLLGSSAALFTKTHYKEILIYGFRNMDPELNHTTGMLNTVSLNNQLLTMHSRLGGRIEYVLQDYYGDMYVGEKDRVEKLPEQKVTELKELYRSANANQSEMSTDQFLENVNKYLCYIQRGFNYQVNFSLTKDESKVHPMILDNLGKKKAENKDYVVETFVKVMGLVVEPLGMSVAG